MLAQCVGGDVIGCCFCNCAVAALATHWRVWLLWPSFVRTTCVNYVNCACLNTWAIVSKQGVELIAVFVYCDAFHQIPSAVLMPYVFQGGRGLFVECPGTY